MGVPWRPKTQRLIIVLEQSFWLPGRRKREGGRRRLSGGGGDGDGVRGGRQRCDLRSRCYNTEVRLAAKKISRPPILGRAHTANAAERSAAARSPLAARRSPPPTNLSARSRAPPACGSIMEPNSIPQPTLETGRPRPRLVPVLAARICHPPGPFSDRLAPCHWTEFPGDTTVGSHTRM